MNPLISVDELVTLREWSDPVVLCASMGPTPPTHGIPGSHLADLEGDFSDPTDPLPHTVPADLTALFASYGVSDGTPVVVYDDQGGATAPRVWWLAQVAGVRARVLDGGLPVLPAEEVVEPADDPHGRHDDRVSEDEQTEGADAPGGVHDRLPIPRYGSLGCASTRNVRA